MSDDRYTVVQRGLDSSGRPCKETKFAWQCIDRVNEVLGGKMVVIQGSFMAGIGASASEGTHNKAGCVDIRTWNLTTSERNLMIHEARRLGAAAWYRTQAQGFDPHSHWVIIGDQPLADLAASQVDMYKKGYNGLGWYAHKDDFPYRPDPIRAYQYQEDNMANADQVMQELQSFHKDFLKFRDGELSRDKASRIRDKERFSKLVSKLGETADVLGALSNSVSDDATKKQLQQAKKEILAVLAEDPDVDGVDNPGDPE